MIYRNVGALISEQTTISLEPKASVQEAAQQMAKHRIGAIAVVELGRLKGIFTERDLVNRVVAKGLQPHEVRLEEVMTKDPVTVTSETALVPSLAIMFERRFRHLPVLDDGHVVGVLSCRDIPTSYWNMFERWESAQSELEIVSG
jgi:CBS domain-containing protein